MSRGAGIRHGVRVVSEASRQTSGENNRQGNRYEDGFAVFRSIKLAPRVIHDGLSVRLREQAGCPVDDLLVREGQRHHYHQLKDDLKITWGEENGKLCKEFIAQKAQCEGREEDFTLTVVVSHPHRQQSLEQHMPEELKGAVTVYHFAAVQRPSEVSLRPDLEESLRQISASRSPGRELLRTIAEGFHLAWVERELDGRTPPTSGRW